MQRKEKWVDVYGYSTKYEVSDLGNVRSKKTGKLLVPFDNGQGYKKVRLYNRIGKWKYQYVHRLVAKAFITNKEQRKQVNHIDGNKSNNTLDNLEWCTPKQNHAHAKRTGLLNKAIKKLSRAQINSIKIIKRISPNISIKALTDYFSVSRYAVRKALA